MTIKLRGMWYKLWLWWVQRRCSPHVFIRGVDTIRRTELTDVPYQKKWKRCTKCMLTESWEEYCG